MLAMTALVLLAAVPSIADTLSTTTIATSTAKNGWSVNYPKQRKVFEMAGRWWVFYSDGSDGVFRSSVDGEAWSEPVAFAPGGHFGHRFGCWFDGAYFHYAFCSAALGAEVSYRRGAPKEDGTIVWSGAAQAAYDTPPDKKVMYPKVLVDAAGRPWIAFMELVYAVPNAPPYDAVVIRSKRSDGVWRTDPEFPHKLVDAKETAGYPDAMGAVLSDGGVYWVYNSRRDGTDAYLGRLWSGGAWQTEEVIARPASEYAFFNLVGEGRRVHVVTGSGTIAYRGRSERGEWTSPETVASGASGHTSISVASNGAVAVSWMADARAAVCGRVLSADGGMGTEFCIVQRDGLPEGSISLNTPVSVDEDLLMVYAAGTAESHTVKAVMAPVTQPR